MPIASPLYTIEIRSRYSIVTGLLDFFPSRWPILSCSDPRMPIVSPFPPLRYAANTPGLMAWQRRYVKVAPGHMEERFDRLNQLLASVIQRFQQYQIPCNCGVLTTGFDAPQVTHIRMAHTTVSRVMYDQIVGLGLRGPEFGGTESCVNLTRVDNFKGDRPQPGYELARNGRQGEKRRDWQGVTHSAWQTGESGLD